MAYLDYNATTPADKRVVDAILPTFQEHFGNPSSTNHDIGMNAMDMVNNARKQVATLVGFNTQDVIFTSGATEANNTVLKGIGMKSDKDKKILYGATEHKSVIETCMHLRECNISVKKIPVNKDGIINLEQLENRLAESQTSIISIMAANSETGVINPIEEIVKLANKYEVLFHCDATQAVGRIPFNAYNMGVDIITISSHKIYGPKGCGAIIASRDARKKLGSIIHGGGQENGIRSGTLNVPGIVGFGMACQILLEENLADMPRQKALRDHFEQRISSEITNISINGVNAKRIPNTTNIRIHGALADAVIINAPNIAISTGSACSSSALEPSHVLTAMGLDRTAADESFRLSIGKPTKQEDINLAVNEIIKSVQYVRKQEERARSVA